MHVSFIKSRLVLVAGKLRKDTTKVKNEFKYPVNAGSHPDCFGKVRPLLCNVYLNKNELLFFRR
jgi:hypothetical protein